MYNKVIDLKLNLLIVVQYNYYTIKINVNFAKYYASEKYIRISRLLNDKQEFLNTEAPMPL